MNARPRYRSICPCAATIVVAAFASFTTVTTADELQLKSGDSLHGEIIRQDAHHVVLNHPSLGEVRVSVDEVSTINLASKQPSVIKQVALSMLQDDPALAGDWHSSLTVGLSGAGGNTETLTFNIGLDSKRETSHDRTTFDLSYYFDSSSGDRTDNKLTVGLRQEWLISDSPWSYFAQARIDYDEFQSWEERLGAHGGVGYSVINEADFTLDLRAGLGVIKELGSLDEDERLEALFGIDVTRQVSEKQSWNLSSTLYPSLDDTSEYRWVTRSNWALRVDEETNMSLTVGIENEYQSDVDPGIDNNDFRITAGLQFDF